MNYLISEEELRKLIDLYDIENRKEIIGDDNSLKRTKRAICYFLKSKTPVEVIAEGEIGIEVSQYAKEGFDLESVYITSPKKGCCKDILLNNLLTEEQAIKLQGNKVRIFIEEIEAVGITKIL